MELNTKEWKQFTVGEIFPKIKIKKYSSIQEEENGAVPFISSSSMNNGVADFSNAKSFDGKCISVSTNGKCFDCFYQEGPIGASCDVEILTNDNLNQYNALFVCAVLKQEAFKWNYGRKPKNDKVFTTLIKLPITQLGEPDWQYMEDYVKNIFVRKLNGKESIEEKLKTKNINNKIPKLKVVNWTECKISKYFDVSRGKRIVKDVDYVAEKTDDYVHPVITASTINNSVDGYYNKTNCPGNSIVCGGEASGMYATYQEERCWVMDRSRIFIPKKEIINKINKYTALFLITIFKKEMFKYSYGRSANPSHILNTKIKLPMKNNELDWEYMENYIKTLPYSDKI